MFSFFWVKLSVSVFNMHIYLYKHTLLSGKVAKLTCTSKKSFVSLSLYPLKNISSAQMCYQTYLRCMQAIGELSNRKEENRSPRPHLQMRVLEPLNFSDRNEN